MSWIILNANRRQWGHETYPTKEAADNELRTFFKGVSGVDFKKFAIEEMEAVGDRDTRAASTTSA
jgi:hypothetical protein